MQLHKMLGIQYPIIQGAMANIATAEFAAAVSNAGGLGIIAGGGMSPEELEESIVTCKRLTKKPFGVNLMLMHPKAAEQAEVIQRQRVALVTTGAGNPGKYIEGFKENGILVFPVLSSVLMAQRMEKLGVDAVIAEGTESGGHVGEMTTMALIPQMVDALSIPVIAAGGIADGRQMAAAALLGASGVQIGTCLLPTKECPIHENYKQAVLKAKDNDTIVTGRIAGTPVRILKNQMAREYVKQEKAGADKMELEKYTLGSLRRAVFEGDTLTGSLMAGQVCGMLKEEKTIAQVLEEMVKTAQEKLAGTNGILES